MKLKNALLTIFLSGCASLPPFPEVTQFGVLADVKPPGFYGINSKTHARYFKTFSDPSMKGAQCLSPADYSASEAWVAAVKQIAETRCR